MNPKHFDQDDGVDGGDDPFGGRPSKSALKRMSHDLQALGKQLLEMPDSRLDDIPMPERLRDALANYKSTRSFEGKRRQLQFIGKVMREVDPEPLRRRPQELRPARHKGRRHEACRAQPHPRTKDHLRADARRIAQRDRQRGAKRRQLYSI